MPPPLPNVDATNVDLSNCDRELIQFSGAVQPHGCMLVLTPSLCITQASANTAMLLDVPWQSLIQGTLSDAFGDRGQAIAARLGSEPPAATPAHIGCVTTASGRSLNVFAHRIEQAIVLECETIPTGPGRPLLDLYAELRSAIAKLQNTPTLQAFFDAAVAQIRRFTGFERVMAYKFLDDGSGHVMAESNADGFAPYLGLHFPASDIPAPARRLFAMSWLRHLPDVDYQPQPLQPETAVPVDLSGSLLRSVSVMYTGYLKNMGVKATLVIPLMKDGQLWGLISAMHESAPRHIAYEVRMAAEFLAHMLSMMMASKEDAEIFAARLRSKDVLDQMMRLLQDQPDLHAGLEGGNGPASITAYIDAGGAAMVTSDKITRLGATPEEGDLRAMATWLDSNQELVTATDRLAETYPAAAALRDTAAGLLAVRLSRRRPEFVMWFRPEQAQTVSWAGNPHKPVEVDVHDGVVRLLPRTSFAIWKESVAGRSRPWTAFEIKAAADFRWAIAEVILARAEETERLNRALNDVNDELDSFAYVASHDLKEPLRGIHHMASFLQRGHGDPKQQTETILNLSKRMDDLIESLLQYSRTGRAELLPVQCDLNTLLDEALTGLTHRIAESRVTIRRAGKLPVVHGDRARLREVLANLVANAIKYNDKAEKWVEIGAEQTEPPVIWVRDNGIGIAERHHERIFEIFRRLHGRDEFGGGTGAGLTIVKKTVERHHGRMWLTSTEGEGTCFFFTIPTRPTG